VNEVKVLTPNLNVIPITESLLPISKEIRSYRLYSVCPRRGYLGQGARVHTICVESLPAEQSSHYWRTLFRTIPFFCFHFDARCFARQLKGVPLQLRFTHGERRRALAWDRNYQHPGADIDPASDIVPKTYSKWYKANVER